MRRQQMGGLGRLLGHLALYRVVGMFKSALDEHPGGDGPLVVRVSPEHYGQNLERMVGQARERGVPIVLVKPAVPLLWPAGLQFKWIHELGEEAQLVFPEQMQRILGRQVKYALDYERMNRNYGRAWSMDTVEVYKSAFVGPPAVEDAIAHYSRLRDRRPDDPVVRNDLGVSLWQNGQLEAADRELRRAVELYRGQHPDREDPASVGAGAAFVFNLGINTLSRSERPDADPRLAGEAWSLLEEARQADYFSLRVKRPYLEEIDRFEGTPGVIVIDGPAIFEARGREQLFVDHCHPTAEGHRLLASAIRERVLDHLPSQPRAAP